MTPTEQLTIIDIDGTVHHVTRAGLLYAYGHRHFDCGLPLTLLSDAAKVADWGRRGGRADQLCQRIAQQHYRYELRYDAAHGRRYMCCAYPSEGDPFSPEAAARRRVTIAAADGISNLREYHLAAGCTEAELDTKHREPFA